MTPHLTVGDTGTAEELGLVQRRVEPQLPIWMDVSRVSLIVGDQQPHSYRTTAAFPLA